MQPQVTWTISCINVLFPFVFQAVIDANIFPILIEILSKGEFKPRKEAAWAIVNATSGGTPEQIRYLFNSIAFD
jgi:importin subunit alpha-2